MWVGGRRATRISSRHAPPLSPASLWHPDPLHLQHAHTHTHTRPGVCKVTGHIHVCVVAVCGGLRQRGQRPLCRPTRCVVSSSRTRRRRRQRRGQCSCLAQCSRNEQEEEQYKQQEQAQQKKQDHLWCDTKWLLEWRLVNGSSSVKAPRGVFSVACHDNISVALRVRRRRRHLTPRA